MSHRQSIFFHFQNQLILNPQNILGCLKTKSAFRIKNAEYKSFVPSFPISFSLCDNGNLFISIRYMVILVCLKFLCIHFCIDTCLRFSFFSSKCRCTAVDGSSKTFFRLYFRINFTVPFFCLTSVFSCLVSFAFSLKCIFSTGNIWQLLSAYYTAVNDISMFLSIQ